MRRCRGAPSPCPAANACASMGPGIPLLVWPAAKGTQAHACLQAAAPCPRPLQWHVGMCRAARREGLTSEHACKRCVAMQNTPAVLCCTTCLRVQDSTYVGLDPPDVVTAWLALTPADTANGCLRFLPGSHSKQARAGRRVAARPTHSVAPGTWLTGQPRHRARLHPPRPGVCPGAD